MLMSVLMCVWIREGKGTWYGSKLTEPRAGVLPFLRFLGFMLDG